MCQAAVFAICLSHLSDVNVKVKAVTDDGWSEQGRNDQNLPVGLKLGSGAKVVAAIKCLS